LNYFNILDDLSVAISQFRYYIIVKFISVCTCQDGYELDISGKQCTGRHGNIYLIEPIAKAEISIDKFM
jgi:hypothetical protein